MDTKNIGEKNEAPLSPFGRHRVMIAASASGSGKTLFTSGLIEVLRRRNIEPCAFKCGPDYIDPMFLRSAGISCRNLDTFFSTEDEIIRSVGDSDGHYTVIEGVMGIYDGISPDSLKGSCYEISEITRTPIVLLMNCAKAGRTLISMLKGVLSDDRAKLIKAVVLNRISTSYYEKLKIQLEKEISAIRRDVVLAGHIPDDADLTIGSRHLGLSLPGETKDLEAKIGRMADLIEEKCDITSIINAAAADDPAPPPKTVSPSKPDHSINVLSGSETILAVAEDEAFCFCYAENLELFERFGAKIRFFSPLQDERIPENASGIYLVGGYPELHLEKLSTNKSMLKSVRDALRSGMPSLAECGGYMYLHRSVADPDGREFDTVGVIDAKCVYTGHLVNFGYVEVRKCCEEADFPADDLRASVSGLKGHEFHYYKSTGDERDVILCKPSTGRCYESMLAGCSRLWGFPHFYHPAHPGFLEAFVNRMREYRNV